MAEFTPSFFSRAEVNADVATKYGTPSRTDHVVSDAHRIAIRKPFVDAYGREPSEDNIQAIYDFNKRAGNITTDGPPPTEQAPVMPAFLQDAERTDRQRQLLAAQQEASTLPSPDEAARLRQVSGAQNLPFTVALANPAALPAQDVPLTWDQHADNKPLSDILLDPEKSALTRDETDALARVAELDKKGFSSFRVGQMWESGSLGIERDSLWFRRGWNGGVSSPEDEARLKTVDARLSLLPQAESLSGQAGESIVQQVPRMLGMTGAGIAGAAVGGVFGTAAGPGGAAAFAAAGSRAAVAAYNAESAIGNAYAEYAGMGVPHNVAWPVGVITGAVVAGLDTLSFGVLAKLPGLKSLGGMPGFSLLNKANIKPAVEAALKDSKFLRVAAGVGEGYATEASTEALQEFVQILGAYASAAAAPGEYKTPTLEEAAGRILMAGFVGGVVGGAFGGAGTVFHESLVRVNAGLGSQETIDHIYDVTEGLKTPERAPDVMKQYGDGLAKDGPIKTVTLPVEDLDKLLQTVRGKEKDSALETWLGQEFMQRKLQDARDGGGRVEISLGDFLAYVRPLDTARSLNQSIGLNDEMSPAEAKELKPAIEKARKEMADLKARRDAAAAEPEARVMADLEHKLLAVGYTAQGARMQAELLTSGIASLARRAGKTTLDVYQNAPLTVTRLTREAKTGGMRINLAPGEAPASPVADAALAARTAEATALVERATGQLKAFQAATADVAGKLRAAEAAAQKTAASLLRVQDEARKKLAKVEQRLVDSGREDVERSTQVRQEALGETERAIAAAEAAHAAALKERDALRNRAALRESGLKSRRAALAEAKASHPKATTLAHSDPLEVQRTVTPAEDVTQGFVYQNPESPLQLHVYDEPYGGSYAPGIADEPLRTAQLGFMPGVEESKDNIAKHGQQGYSTALYVKALQDARDEGYGWRSDTIRTPATNDIMYPRLQRMGFPFRLMKTVPEAGDRSADFFYLSNADLKKINFTDAWNSLIKEYGVLAGASQEQLDALVNGLTELQHKQSNEVRGTITFDSKRRDWFAITLTGKANLSTFLHESSHYLLELMRKLALESPESDLVADLKVLEEWAGVKPGEDWSVAALEKFARGMETYFGEGRAPSAGLASAFATFKTWIIHVYKTLTALGTPLTDEVRGVMDRMLVTQDEIDARRTELGYFPNDFVLSDEDMTPAEQARYRDLYEKGARQAQAALDREAIAALRKEKNAEYQRIAAAAEREVDSHPTIALRAYLEGKGRPDGGLVPEVNGKFNIDLVPENLRNKLAAYITPTGGIDPGDLAPYFGFKNATEMLQSLATTPARSTLKSAMVKAEMTKLYPAYGPDKAWVERTALERLHESDGIATALEIELRVLYRKAKLLPPNSPALVAQHAAKAAVAEMSRKEMSPAQWRNGETRLLREQQKALAAKDFKAAAEAARKRLFSRAMWQEVQKAAAAVDAAEKYAKGFAHPERQGALGRSSNRELTSGERLGGVIRDAVKNLIEAVGLTESSYASEQSFDVYIRKLEETGAPVSIDPVLRERALKKWDDLTYMEVMAVKDALKNLSAVARDANTVRIGEQKARLSDIADRVEARLAEVGLANREGFKGEDDSTVRMLRAQTTKPETIAIDLDGGTPGLVHELLIGSAEKGQFERDRRFRQRRDELTALGQKFRPKDWYKLTHEKHTFLDGRTYTGAQVFAMLLNFGSASNRHKLVEGMVRAGRTGWTEQNVLNFIHQVFPRKDVYAYADAILKYISQSNLWEDAATVRESIAGVRPEKVEALAIPTPDGGSIEGGYYPLVYDRNALMKDAVVTDADALDAMEAANPLNLYAANGFTKGRTGYVAPLNLDPTALAAHIYEVDHFISNAQGIIDRHKFLNEPRIKAAIVKAVGHEYWDTLRASNNYIAADGKILTREAQQITRYFDRLIYHNALLTMGGNVLSGMNQIISGVPATLAQLGPRGVPAFGKALLEFARNPFSMWEKVGKLSGEIQGMEFHYDRDLRLVISREVTGESWDHIRSRVAAITMAPVVFGQKIVNVITWQAAYSLAAQDGANHERAVALANSAVRQSQSASAPKDMTAVQQSKNGILRILTSLASYTFTLNDLVMPRRATRRELVSATSRLIIMALTGMMTKALLDAMFPRLEEEEAQRRKGLEKAAENTDIPGLLLLTQTMLDMMSNVPLVGRTAASVVSGREPRYASWVDSAVKAMQATPDALSDKGLGKAELKAVVDTIGLVSGTPTRHVLFAPGEFMHEYLDGNVESDPWSLFQELAIVRPGQKGVK